MLKISNNKQSLVNEENGVTKPFFWLGDTAWLLFQKLNKVDAEKYFENRKERNFNVIQSVLVHNLNVENPKPENIALSDGDFSKIDLSHGYWDRVISYVKLAQRHGLIMGLLPCWGSMVKKGYLNENNAEDYAKFLCSAFGDCKNIVWILGGDIRGSVGENVWNILGKTLKHYMPNILITFHPFGRTSSAMWFNDKEWLDFNMFQSGHRRYDQNSLGFWDDNNVTEDFYGEDNWRYVRRELSRDIVKPVLDGEPSYEGIPQGLHDFTQPLWQAKDVRRYAYWSTFEGACGHTYGSNAVMQFYSPGDTDGGYGVKEFWFDAIKSVGSEDMKHLYNLLNRFDYSTCTHMDDVVDNEGFNKYDRITALGNSKNILIYNYSGRDFSINCLGYKYAYLFDPTNGDFKEFSLNAEGYIKDIPKNADGETDFVFVMTTKPVNFSNKIIGEFRLSL